MHLDSTTKGSPRPSTHSMAVIDDQQKKHDDERLHSDAGPSNETDRLLPSGSTRDIEPAPSYEELAVDLPPNFSPYEAEYEVTSSGDFFSHDRHLNDDGEALYRFLVAHATVPPNLLLKCRGTHAETRTRYVTRTETRDGRTTTRTEPESYTETVVDFDFSIDLSHHLRQLPPVYWTVPDDEPAYRGGMSREVLTDVISGVRRVPSRVLKAGKLWREKREKWGLPPWLSQTDPGMVPRKAMPADELVSMRSELSLRQWADRYCASHKSMKEFKFRKVAYGWNFEILTEAVRGAIRPFSYGLNTNITVEFSSSADTISIRPSTKFSRALSKTWVCVLLWILLVYPFIWLYRRFHGGHWEVAGAAFPLRAWKHCEDSIPGESAAEYRTRRLKEGAEVASIGSEGADERVMAESPQGVSQLVGTNERDWFNMWISTITHCVRHRVQEKAPLITPYGVHASGAPGYDWAFGELPHRSLALSQRSNEHFGFSSLSVLDN